MTTLLRASKVLLLAFLTIAATRSDQRGPLPPPNPCLGPDAALAVLARALHTTPAVPWTQRATCQGTAVAVHDCGVRAFLRGDTTIAVVLLREATERAPKIPTHWVDLAIALQARAQTNTDPQQLVSALVASDQSLLLQHDFTPGVFVRASTLELLGLHLPARHAYRECMIADPASGWAGAAMTRVRYLRSAAREFSASALLDATDDELVAIVGTFPVEARAYAEDVLLAQWATHERAGASAMAAARLALARRIGRALQQNADASLANTVACIDHATPQQRRTLTDGHILFGEARAAYQHAQLAVARRHFARAADAFLAGEARRCGSRRDC